MDLNIQQHVCIEANNGSQTVEMLQPAVGESCLTLSGTFQWHSQFFNEEDFCQGRQSTWHIDENDDRVHDIILADWFLTVREVAHDLGILISACYKVLIEHLHMSQQNLCFVS